MTASGLTFFPVRDSLEEPDLLGPCVREAVGAGASVVPVEPVPVLADPYPLFHHVRQNPDGGLSRMIRSSLSMPMGIGSLVLMPLALTVTEVLFKPWFPGYIGVAYEWFWFLLFFLFGYICITARKSTTGSSRARGC